MCSLDMKQVIGCISPEPGKDTLSQELQRDIWKAMSPLEELGSDPDLEQW